MGGYYSLFLTVGVTDTGSEFISLASVGRPSEFNSESSDGNIEFAVPIPRNFEFWKDFYLYVPSVYLYQNDQSNLEGEKTTVEATDETTSRRKVIVRNGIRLFRDENMDIRAGRREIATLTKISGERKDQRTKWRVCANCSWNREHHCIQINKY